MQQPLLLCGRSRSCSLLLRGPAQRPNSVGTAQLYPHTNGAVCVCVTNSSTVISDVSDFVTQDMSLWSILSQALHRWLGKVAKCVIAFRMSNRPSLAPHRSFRMSKHPDLWGFSAETACWL